MQVRARDVIVVRVSVCCVRVSITVVSIEHSFFVLSSAKSLICIRHAKMSRLCEPLDLAAAVSSPELVW